MWNKQWQEEDKRKRKRADDGENYLSLSLLGAVATRHTLQTLGVLNSGLRNPLENIMAAISKTFFFQIKYQ